MGLPGDERRLTVPKIAFGEVDLSDAQRGFLRELNQEILLLSKSLPESTQTDAMLFFMKHSGLTFGEELNFFKSYYAPTWSIIYWLLHSSIVDVTFDADEAANAKTGHGMAMFLHAIDDHLNDGELPASHLTLLLRSQAWMIMNQAFSSLCADIEDGRRIVHDFLDDYYSSIRDTGDMPSLDAYTDRFTKQMATGMIAPALMIKRWANDQGLSEALQKAYGSFGIAWRLLDDIQDIELDVTRGVHTSVYLCLSDTSRLLWDSFPRNTSEEARVAMAMISESILEEKVVETLVDRIQEELESAALLADNIGLSGWAEEVRCLMRPLCQQPWNR